MCAYGDNNNYGGGLAGLGPAVCKADLQDKHLVKGYHAHSAHILFLFLFSSPLYIFPGLPSVTADTDSFKWVIISRNGQAGKKTAKPRACPRNHASKSIMSTAPTRPSLSLPSSSTPTRTIDIRCLPNLHNNLRLPNSTPNTPSLKPTRTTTTRIPCKRLTTHLGARSLTRSNTSYSLPLISGHPIKITSQKSASQAMASWIPMTIS